jgi:hypothetical protein
MDAKTKLKHRIDGLDESIKSLEIIKKDLKKQLSDLDEATFLKGLNVEVKKNGRV